MLQELLKLPIPTHKFEEPSIIWSNSIISVRTEQYIHFIEISKQTQNIHKEISTNISSLPVSKARITADLLTENLFKNPLNNIQLSEVLLDPGYASFNKDLVEQMSINVAFCWSPVNIFCQNPVVSVLNNLGNIEFYSRKHAGWKCILKLTTLIKELRKDDLHKLSGYENLRATINSIVATTICWSPHIHNLNYFLSGLRNGSILIWFITEDKEEFNAELSTEINTKFGELYRIEWIPTGTNSFILICANVLGQIFGQQCMIKNENIIVIQDTCLWEAQDNMITKYLAYIAVDDKIIIGYSKYRHFVVQMLDASGNLLSQVVNNLNDYKITDVKIKNNCFLISTINMKIFKVNFALNGKDLQLNINQVHFKDSYANYELHSIDFSENDVLWALSVRDRQPNTERFITNFNLVFMTYENTNVEELLLNNPSKKLTQYWDCIELLRYKSMKDRKLPSIYTKQLYNDGEVDIYKLKLYLILQTFYDTFERLCCNNDRNILPNTSSKIIKDQIFLWQAKHQLSLLNAKFKKEKALSNLETEYFKGCETFIRYYCKKYYKTFSELVPEECADLKLDSAEYQCMFCDAILEGYSCKNNHCNMFCTLTFTPIVSDEYLICTACKHTARIDLRNEKPMCLFCDLYLTTNCV